MACILCKVSKLSEEFPPYNASPKCDHACLTCLRVRIISLTIIQKWKIILTLTITYLFLHTNCKNCWIVLVISHLHIYWKQRCHLAAHLTASLRQPLPCFGKTLLRVSVFMHPTFLYYLCFFLGSVGYFVLNVLSFEVTISNFLYISNVSYLAVSHVTFRG